MLRFTIKREYLVVLLSLLLMEYKIENITIRNANGAQFIAGVVRKFLKDKWVYQEFTYVATPEENAYIEAIHSTIQGEIVERFELEFNYHAHIIYQHYYDWYNHHHKHGALEIKSAEQYLRVYNLKYVSY